MLINFRWRWSIVHFNYTLELNRISFISCYRRWIMLIYRSTIRAKAYNDFCCSWSVCSHHLICSNWFCFIFVITDFNYEYHCKRNAVAKINQTFIANALPFTQRSLSFVRIQWINLNESTCFHLLKQVMKWMTTTWQVIRNWARALDNGDHMFCAWGKNRNTFMFLTDGLAIPRIAFIKCWSRNLIKTNNLL